MTWGAAFDPHPGPVLHVLSGALLVALAAFVASVRPRRPGNLAFAAFAGAWGLSTVLGWSVRTSTGLLVADAGSALYLGAQGSSVVLQVVAALFLPLVALAFPRRLDARERRVPVLAAAGALAFVALATFAWTLGGGWPGPGASAARIAAAFESYGLLVLLFGSFLFALLVLLQRARLADAEAERRRYVLLSVALVPPPAFLVGIWASGGFEPRAVVPVQYAALAALAVLWLRQARGGGDAERAGRRFAHLALALPLAGWALHETSVTLLAATEPPGILGAARTITVLVLGYAILRHQLLGIDVKLRWTLSRSTIAAVFIAVFFVASEAAQQFFGETLGSSYVGILAAGALVFAIAPLSKLADRVAEKAMPVAAGPTSGSGASSGAEASYRVLLRRFLADGNVSVEEERALADLADRLGIGARRALDLRIEVAEESGRDRPPADGRSA